MQATCRWSVFGIVYIKTQKNLEKKPKNLVFSSPVLDRTYHARWLIFSSYFVNYMFWFLRDGLERLLLRCFTAREIILSYRIASEMSLFVCQCPKYVTSLHSFKSHLIQCLFMYIPYRTNKTIWLARPTCRLSFQTFNWRFYVKTRASRLSTGGLASEVRRCVTSAAAAEARLTQ